MKKAVFKKQAATVPYVQGREKREQAIQKQLKVATIKERPHLSLLFLFPL